MMRLDSVASSLMAALFGLAAVLQYNDPDPLRWIALYGAAAAICIGHILGRRVWPLAAALAAIATLAAIALLPEVLGYIGVADLFNRMEEKGGRVEIGREIGGLVLVAVWMAVLAALGRKRGSASARPGSAMRESRPAA